MTSLSGIVVGIVILLAASPFLLFDYFHTSPALNTFSEQLTLAMPTDTKTIDSVSEFGTVTGNGDHCDFLTAALVETELSRDNFEDYVRSNYKGERSELHFTWWSDRDATASISRPQYSNFGPLLDIALRNIASRPNQVLVYAYRPDAVFDLRCLI